MVGEVARSLPSGRVTFLFTDIEGSTKVLKRLPDQAGDVFERHDSIVRQAIRHHGGVEVNTEGDAFFAAFDDADAALATCAAAQIALESEDWPVGGTIRVRMGVHTGTAAPRRDNYVALAVHQAARVVAAAHGGQVLVSDTALSELRRPPPGHVVTLGRYRVRDFDEPQLLHRLDPFGLPVTDRPIRALPASGHNLVAPMTSFVGRDREAVEITSLLRAGRILSLVGPGGTGKTRLAIEVARGLVRSWADGVWFVGLADVTDSSLVSTEIANALGLAPAAVDRWHDVLSWATASTSVLIIDNIENHLAVCADLLPELIRHPGIAVMTTSREPLHVPGESLYRVGPLAVPSVDAGSDGQASPSVELFLDRARARRHDIAVDDRVATDIIKLCAQLDGLPLAIEIAAARTGSLTVAEILAGLEDHRDSLRSPDRTLPERHRTMSNVLSWSHDLLDPAERVALRRLAVFGGSFTVAAAVAALADDDLPAPDVPEMVWALVEKSLAVADLTESATRYRLPETVKRFATGLLVEHEEDAATSRRAAAELLERVGPWLPNDRRWIGEVAVELANVRALIPQLIPHDSETAQQLACSVARYHDAVQSFRNGIEEVGAVASLDDSTPTRVVLLTTLADLHLRCGETTEASQLVDVASRLAAVVGAPEWNDAAVDRTRGELLTRTGAYEEASIVAREALAQGLSPLGQARMWNLDGIGRYGAGDMEAGFDAFTHELAIYQELDHEANVASAHGNLAELALHLGRRSVAASHQQACLELALEIGQPVMLAFSSLVAARLAAEDGDWPLAVRLLASAEAELDEAGHTLYSADQEVVDGLRSTAIERLGAATVDALCAAGSEIGPVEAAALAAGVFDAVVADRPETDPPAPSDERKTT